MTDAAHPLAHSSPDGLRDGQTYAAHVRAVVAGALANARDMCGDDTRPPEGFLDAVESAARFHDLGKLDPDIQAVLRGGRGGKPPWDHVDAGCVHLVAGRNRPAAFIVRAHHKPGLPKNEDHFNIDNKGAKLRGRRHDTGEAFDTRLAARTDRMLDHYLASHAAALGRVDVPRVKVFHGLALRLALSCVVDADHTDTAAFDTERPSPEPLAPLWAERLAALDAYVAGRAAANRGDPERDRLRARFYEACRNAGDDGPITACEGPVGIGKTTAVTAYLLGVADRRKLRHLIIVAPYTNIISQTVKVLREALTLSGEAPDAVVVEHHHRADFADIDSRELAITWRAPVVVTTAVQFFETLAARDPAALRKLNQLPRSAVFIDEAHAALPAALWPQNWRWLDELAASWSCRFVFASGSLARFWENADIVDTPVRLPHLMPADLAETAAAAEQRRVCVETLGHLDSVDALVAAVSAPERLGPRLVILNTVQSAAVVARAMRDKGLDVLHLSTALCPRDRDAVLAWVGQRLRGLDTDWTLVATSCVEAGVDLSFRVAFRERFGVANLLQVAGRVNRHGEHDADGGGWVFDFTLADGDGIIAHPTARYSASVLGELLKTGCFQDAERLPADLVTRAMVDELRDKGGLHAKAKALLKAEREKNYPEVAELGRVIEADTRLVAVDPDLIQRLASRDKVTSRDLLRGSVQMWTHKIAAHHLGTSSGRPDVYVWSGAYDPAFLGYMAAVLEWRDIDQAGIFIA